MHSPSTYILSADGSFLEIASLEVGCQVFFSDLVYLVRNREIVDGQHSILGMSIKMPSHMICHLDLCANAKISDHRYLNALSSSAKL